MALDAHLRSFLDDLKKQGAPPWHTMMVADAREAFRGFPSFAMPPIDLPEVTDFKTANDLGCRLYRPEQDAVLPALIYFHGGGWVLGDLDSLDSTLRRLAAAAGCAIISVDYRLAPEHKYPEPLHDCYGATCALIQQADELKLDTTRVGVGGDSAGGNLATAVAMMIRDRGGPQLRHQLLVYPVTDAALETRSYHEFAEGYGLTREDMRWFWEQYLPSPEAGERPYASPLKADNLQGLPPTSVFTVEFDPLRDEGAAYARRLEEAGVPVDYHNFDGLIHGIFQVTALYDRHEEVINTVASALTRRLGRV